ncbi:hypothetical protein M758_6G019900 [Ceratodon purpureus]|nr:hypothetical protein M758_6G019900 [Ceratodon purpureus]
MGDENPSSQFGSGCLFMASIFAFTSIYKTRIKVDKELSLWIPLHIGTAILSFCHAFWINRWSRVVGHGLLVGSASVFLKETTQCVTNGHFDWQSFASIDMQKHDVREKIGSLIIILTVGLQLNASEGLFPSISK